MMRKSQNSPSLSTAARLLLLSCLTTSAFTLFSCRSAPQTSSTDDEIVVTVPGSELYVRVRGDAEGPLLVNLHGGPGGYSGIDIKLMGPALEEKFLVAYLDQRGCGKSLTCEDTTMLTVEQYVQDLDIVIDILMHLYNKKAVSLTGTSWGGMFGFLYLLEHPDKIASYACIDGKVNSHYQNHSLIDYEMRRALEIADTTTSASKRDEMAFIISELKRIKNSNFENFHTDVNWMKHEVPAMLGFNAYFVDTSKVISFSDVIEDTALLGIMRYTPEEYAQIGDKAEMVNASFRNTPSYNNINIEAELKNIQAPTLVVQGEKDHVVGVGHARLIYDALTGLDEQQKALHIIPGVAHCPAIESPDRLSEILVSFFEKHAI
ncbi:MAG: alpha/beta hydrolase [Bacteroidales bacterium]|nr:alpha/beta hydrolase [Bacteroidales bacterium]